VARDSDRPVSSPDPRMMLVPVGKSSRWRSFILVLFTMVIVAGGCLGAGFFYGSQSQMQVSTEVEQLKSTNAQLQQQLDELQSQTAINKHGIELERQASERVRQENVQLQNKVSELQEAVNFYKSIMVPGKNDKGLRIEKIELSSTFNKRRFKYKVVMTQVADNSSFIQGKVSMNLLGVRQGKKESLSFKGISGEFESSSVPFKFRYFQDVAGEVVLPDGFVPEQIEVIAQSKGRKATRLEKRFDWKVQEVTSDVGKG